MQALEDVEREIRKRFGFAERENVIMMPLPEPYREKGES